MVVVLTNALGMRTTRRNVMARWYLLEQGLVGAKGLVGEVREMAEGRVEEVMERLGASGEGW